MTFSFERWLVGNLNSTCHCIPLLGSPRTRRPSTRHPAQGLAQHPLLVQGSSDTSAAGQGRSRAPHWACSCMGSPSGTSKAKEPLLTAPTRHRMSAL